MCNSMKIVKIVILELALEFDLLTQNYIIYYIS